MSGHPGTCSCLVLLPLASPEVNMTENHPNPSQLSPILDCLADIRDQIGSLRSDQSILNGRIKNLELDADIRKLGTTTGDRGFPCTRAYW